MRRLLIYADASVIGGCEDAEFQADSLALLATFKLFNAVNIERGYGLLEIRTPREVLIDAE